MPEPVPNLAALKRVIQSAYDLSVTHIEYLPLGWVSAHYRLECADGRCYFITLYGESRVAQICRRQLWFTLPLTYQLYHSGLFTHLAPPLPTVSGELQVDSPSGTLVVYPYIEGHPVLDEAPSDALQAEFGQLVAQLHSAAQQIKPPKTIQEQYTFHFEAPLRRGLQVLDTICDGERWGRVALRDMLLPHRTLILGLMDELLAMAQTLKQTSQLMVFCHSDMHGANMLRTPQGELVVVDWDGVCLAPPEYDLFIFTGDGFETFLRAYYQAGGVRQLSASRFAFYFYRRNLEDLTDWIVRILDENNSQEQDRLDLDGIKQDCIAGWHDLPGAIPRMQEILDRIPSG